MPTVTPRAIQAGSAALIVGNGPSGKVRSWPLIWRWLGRETGKLPDICLINWSALGATVPRYAVACDTDVLRGFLAHGIHRRTVVVCNSIENTCGPDRAPEHLDELFEANSVVLGRPEWPALASGPLATWTLTALGYETLYLYGLDGTARPFPAGKTGEMEHRARTWEALIARHADARAEIDGATQLVRVWPRADLPTSLAEHGDPLAEALTATLLAP